MLNVSSALLTTKSGSLVVPLFDKPFPSEEALEQKHFFFTTILVTG